MLHLIHVVPDHDLLRPCRPSGYRPCTAHDQVPKVLKFGVVLQLRIAKVLNLAHRELTHPYQHKTRQDLVTKRVANLGGGKRQLFLVELWQALEVGEDSLCVLALVLQLLRCVR